MPPTFKKTASSKGAVGAKALADDPAFLKPEGEEACEINARAEAKAEVQVHIVAVCGDEVSRGRIFVYEGVFVNGIFFAVGK